jgi:hypothetical protein
MAFRNINEHLWRESIRARRKDWSTTSEFADEVYLILSSIPQINTGPLTIEGPDGNPIEFPSVDDLNFPPWDLDFPEDGITPPELEQDPDDPTQSSTVTEQWHRTIFPGKVISQSGTSENYNIDIYPEGRFGAARSIVARLTDPELAGSIDPNVWLYVYRAIKYVIREETFGSFKQTTVDTSVQEYTFNAPPQAGGRVARVSATISAREGLTPGSGSAVLYQIDSESGSLTTSSEADVTVYNMVTSEVTAGADKFIQVKKIGGLWWIDVEDCSSLEDTT